MFLVVHWEFLFFLEKEDDSRPLQLGDAYGHFIDYSQDLTKYYNNESESTILATHAATSIQNDEGVLAGPLPKPLT